MMILLVMATTVLVTAAGVEIVRTSPREVMVRRGDALDLYCDSITPYQWCYWAHNGSEYPTTSHKGGGEKRQPTVWGFEWRKSSTRCGLHFSAVMEWAAGDWKCHLANTDSTELEKIRAEAWISVEVARPAAVKLHVTGQEKEEEEEVVRVVWGEEVSVRCSPRDSGHPPPVLQLSLLNSSAEAAEESKAGSEAELSYFPTLQESGARFSCRWRQEAGQETLYQGQELSAPLDVVMAPSLLLEVETSRLYYPGLTISPQLMSRPLPAPAQVTWRILTENQTVFSVPEAGEAGLVDLLVSEVVNLARDHEWETSLQLFNLTENLTAWLHVETEVGSLDKMFLVTLPDPSQVPDWDLVSMTQSQVTLDPASEKPLDMTAVSIVGLIALIVFTIFLVTMTLVVVRSRRKEHGDKDKPESELEQYRRVPLIPPEASHVCSDSGSFYSGGYQGLTMNTFGKGEAGGYTRSDTIPSLTSPSSVDTDRLSSLGVRLKEFPDPLADWEDLEPELGQRRSVHTSDSKYDVLFRIN